jgi:hypothetical protein
MNTHLEIGVIMDTSVDRITPTLDFLLEQGINPTMPTDEYFARLLFSVLDDLKKNSTLADIIGNRPLEAFYNSKLKWAVRAESHKTSLYPDTIRAKEIYSTRRAIVDAISGRAFIYSYVYIACSRTDAYWLLVDRRLSDIDTDGRFEFTQLDSRSMVEFFSNYHEYADHIGLQILRELIKLTHQQTHDWSKKQRRLEQAATLLDFTSQCVALACAKPRTSGDGIEG